MEFVNATPMNGAFTLGLDPSGRERLVVVVKGTFRIPLDGGAIMLARASDPLVYADRFAGEPGLSAVVYESDFAPWKPQCDVLLVGSAHAPEQRPVTRLRVALQVGAMAKAFDVVGDRHWAVGALGTTATNPKPFVTMPLTYGRAFGGRGDRSPDDPGLSLAYGPNPVGVGYFERARDQDVFGKPLPNTEESGQPVVSPQGTYRPMSLGPLGRNFQMRYPLAGTYDQRWLDEVFPFLPADFDARYHQSAPLEQRIPYPTGGETIELINLAPRFIPAFTLPSLRLPIEITKPPFEPITQGAVVDTIVLEPDEQKMQIVWRTSFPLVKGIREISQVIVGRMTKGFYRAREGRKVYFRSLGALAEARQREA